MVVVINLKMKTQKTHLEFNDKMMIKVGGNNFNLNDGDLTIEI